MLEHIAEIGVDLVRKSHYSFHRVVEMTSSSADLYAHSMRTSLYATLLGKASGYEPLEQLAVALMVHDIGKTVLPEGLLETHSLTDKQWEQVKEHPRLGVEQVHLSRRITAVARDVIHNHSAGVHVQVAADIDHVAKSHVRGSGGSAGA